MTIDHAADVRTVAGPSSKSAARRQRLLDLDIGQRRDALNAHLRQRLRIWLLADDATLDAFDPRRLLDPLGKDWAFLAHMLQQDFGLRLYPNELHEMDSIEALASYLSAELVASVPAPSAPTAPAVSTEGAWVWEAPGALPVDRVTGTAFVLSTPRSGSTLLRVMLEGHSNLFAPPELWLLPFATLRDRQQQLRATGYEYLGLGLQQAVGALWEIDETAAAATVQAWVEDGRTVADTLRQLVARADRRWLIDKTPGYSSRIEWLQQAERVCDDARYVFLVRHPFPVIESFVRMRFHRMIGSSLGVRSDDPFLLAALVWERWNRNVVSFFESIPADRRLQVRYEDLVSEPADTMRAVAEFLGVPFESSMTSPYATNRMTFKGTKHLITTGDPNFARRDRLDPRLSSWDHIHLPEHIRRVVRDLAAQFGYQVPS